MSNLLTKFAIIADPHYYSETLGNSGKAYERRAGSDQKMLALSRGTILAALEHIKNSDAKFLLIAGDLSNDGERASHEEMREILYEFKKIMPVFVITAPGLSVALKPQTPLIVVGSISIVSEP